MLGRHVVVSTVHFVLHVQNIDGNTYRLCCKSRDHVQFISQLQNWREKLKQ